MNLCIDIGNSTSKIAVFKNRNIIHKKKFDNPLFISSLETIFDTYPIRDCIVCTTRKENKELVKDLKKHTPCQLLTSNIKLPVKIKYKTPTTLGTDRIAAVIGAYMPSAHNNHLVIDAGTCITYDVIDKNGIYFGGNIAPGVEMRIQAMHDYTAKLPLVKMKFNKSFIGNTTKTALQNGAVWGTIFEIEAFIKHVKSIYKRINITLTGGNAEFLAGKFKTKIFVSPNLVLIGLNEILQFQNIEI